ARGPRPLAPVRGGLGDRGRLRVAGRDDKAVDERPRPARPPGVRVEPRLGDAKRRPGRGRPPRVPPAGQRLSSHLAAMKVTTHGENLTKLMRLRFVNAYLVREPDGLTLVDTMISGSAKGIIAAAERAGTPIVRIVLTHAHVDHVGS